MSSAYETIYWSDQYCHQFAGVLTAVVHNVQREARQVNLQDYWAGAILRLGNAAAFLTRWKGMLPVGIMDSYHLEASRQDYNANIIVKGESGGKGTGRGRGRGNGGLIERCCVRNIT